MENRVVVLVAPDRSRRVNVRLLPAKNSPQITACELPVTENVQPVAVAGVIVSQRLAGMPSAPTPRLSSVAVSPDAIVISTAASMRSCEATSRSQSVDVPPLIVIASAPDAVPRMGKPGRKSQSHAGRYPLSST